MKARTRWIVLGLAAIVAGGTLAYVLLAPHGDHGGQAAKIAQASGPVSTVVQSDTTPLAYASNNAHADVSLKLPAMLASDPDLHARLTLFDKDNSPIVHLGDDLAWRKKVLAGFKVRADEKQWQPGKFVHPHDACFDKDGNIFVVEWVNTGRVTLLKRVA